jgi:ABC-type sugar transport system ATPase subunit
MTVRNHLGFGLSIRKWDRQRIKKRVIELAETLKIPHLLDRTPQGLSGGERQRVSLGRALSYYPNVLCLDEPFSALDDETREDMYQLLKLIIDQTSITIFHITHSDYESRRLADKIFRIENGKILERGD